MVKGQDEFQVTPYQQKANDKKERIIEYKIKENIRKDNDNWNYWNFKLHWDNL